MISVSTPLGISFSATLSLLGIDTSAAVTFGLSAGQTAQDIFELYGTLDAAATDATNARLIGRFTGGAANLPRDFQLETVTWPYLLVRRVGGSTPGTFYVTGDATTNPAPVTVSAPAGNAFSAVLNLMPFAANGVRVGGSAAMVSGDVFDVYVSQDAAATGASGCLKAGRITGGGGTGITSLLVTGWPYALVQRTGGATAGTIIAAGVILPTGPAGPAGPAGPTGPAGPAGPGGPVATGTATTIGNVTSVLISYPVPANTVLVLRVSVASGPNAGGNANGYLRAITVKRVGAGNAVIVGSPASLLTNEDTAPANVLASTSGANLVVSVLGAPLQTLDWSGNLYLEVQHP